MKLGRLIQLLESCQQDAIIIFDFGRCVPTTVCSSRGDYSDLSLQWAYDDPKYYERKVADVLVNLKAAIGKTFTGYKGGDYRMDQYTQICVDNSGDWTNTQIVGVRDLGYGYVVIDTRNGED